LKKLNEKKITTIDSDVVINKYQSEYINVFDQNIKLSALNDKYLGIIQYAYAMDPDAFPAEFTIEEKENGNGTDNK